ncbi:hypothetical protein JCM19233_814 [Vibrio astriarenae]|nr:hypothetical protein JCM19233_814 [Vibrio sp. C7]
MGKETPTQGGHQKMKQAMKSPSTAPAPTPSFPKANSHQQMKAMLNRARAKHQR